MSKLGSRGVTELHVELPPSGGWTARARLESGEPPASGATTLTLGDLVLVGRIIPNRGGVDAPAHPSVVVAGGAGWRIPLPAPGGAYASAGGVRLTTVLADLARIAGESYVAPAEVNLGTAYGWDASTPRRAVRASAVLADLVARGAIPLWRVDPTTGRTVFTAWPSLGPADAHGRIEDRSLADGARMVALDSAVAAWLPGATIQGVTIARVTFDERDSELRATVWDS